MKGIILAGGAGSRLYPNSLIYSKQLTMIYDKPMIYYSLSVLMLIGIREILIITDEKTLPAYKMLFQDGSHLGLSISYRIQTEPRGLAEAFLIGEEFIGNDSVTMILGDNIFYGKLDFIRSAQKQNQGATVFGYYVKDPQRYGVIEFSESGEVISIEEKPQKPKSNYAVVGLYIYDNDVVKYAKNLQPSARGELEITDLNNEYLKRSKLKVELFGRGIAWLDTGTPQTLLEASTFIGAVEHRQDLKIACIEEIALTMNYISKKKFRKLINNMPKCSYRDYLLKIYYNSKIKI
ncbi:MAG: glucose-1-phosphate thymidylyltransferase RfbA [Candidatus Cloacimonetes bacterium]|nr:glucose-1-phosphate thymidylyltransferase RfbA [Candidatus Cloacimonadota bacterium]MCF7884805.1 glucose-1-phosphate thymidylyltransferase RfbA [Candidatus Cloacimonadota bacterium]